MATKKKVSSTKQRASVGRELRLALALRAVLDAIRDVPFSDTEKGKEVTTAEADANNVLIELGYPNLESVPSRVAFINEQLRVAVDSGDGKEIARLGNELVRAQQGKPPLKSPAPPAPKKSPRSDRAKSSPASTATGTDGAGDAGGE